MTEKKTGLRPQLLKSILIEWNKIPEGSYLREISAIRELTQLDFRYPVTFFVGENGSGKSTVLEAIAVACGFNPEGGTRNYNFSTYDSHSELCNAVRLVRGVRRINWGYFFRAESFYNVATMEEEYGKDPSSPREPEYYHRKSHGESFLALAQKTLRENGLYFFDEPEAALSPQRQLTMMMEIYRCAEKGAQFIIATHSPILLGMPGAEILSFDGGTIHPCEYEETESYQVTSMFINHREQMLHQLLD